MAAEKELMQERASGEEREKAREKPEGKELHNDRNIEGFGPYGLYEGQVGQA
jgi:hypothetical protein